MFIHSKSTDVTTIARLFIEHGMVSVAMNLMSKTASEDVVEIGIWCLSEVALCDGFVAEVWLLCCVVFWNPLFSACPPFPQLRRLGTVQVVSKFCVMNPKVVRSGCVFECAVC
jgi:hypothetical protein